MDLDKAYSVKTPEDSRKLYAEWAATYDESFIKTNDYVYPRRVAEHFDTQVPHHDIKIVLDIGCGTGAVGSFLASLRSSCIIDGFDISPEMLSHAVELKRIDNSPVYRELIAVDLTGALPDRNYDAMVSAGTFTHGHLGPETLVALIQLVRVGGWFVIGINAEHFELRGFKQVLRDTYESGSISEPTVHQVQVYGPSSPHFGDCAKLATFRRLK